MKKSPGRSPGSSSFAYRLDERLDPVEDRLALLGVRLVTSEGLELGLGQTVQPRHDLVDGQCIVGRDRKLDELAVDGLEDRRTSFVGGLVLVDLRQLGLRETLERRDDVAGRERVVARDRQLRSVLRRSDPGKLGRDSAGRRIRLLAGLARAAPYLLSRFGSA